MVQTRFLIFLYNLLYSLTSWCYNWNQESYQKLFLPRVIFMHWILEKVVNFICFYQGFWNATVKLLLNFFWKLVFWESFFKIMSDTFYLILKVRLHWRLSTILKTSDKNIWSNIFWYVKVCIFWKRIQYTIHWDKTQILKKFCSDKINGTKNALVVLLQAPTHHSSTFNLWFLYELKHKVCLFKYVFGIFHFWFCFVLLKFIFLFNKMHGLSDFKTS